MDRSQKPQSEAFEQAFIRLNAEVTDAFNRGDIDKCASLYSEDAILFLADRPAVKGRAAIREALQEFADAGAKLAPVKLLKIRASGDMGICAGTYTFVMPSASGTAIRQRGKFVTVFVRQPEGAWKAVIDSLLGD